VFTTDYCLRLYRVTLAAEWRGDRPFMLTDAEMITRADSYFAWNPGHHTARTNIQLAESLEIAVGTKSTGRGDMDVTPRDTHAALTWISRLSRLSM
jgi:hypothetical protein